MSLKNLFHTKTRDRDYDFEHYEEDASFKMPIEDIFEEIKKRNIKSLSSRDYLQVEDFFEKDENGKTLLEIVYEYNVSIESNLAIRIFNDPDILEECIKHKNTLLNLIVKPLNNSYALDSTVLDRTLFSKLSNGMSFIEFLIKNNKIGLFVINRIEDIRVFDLLVKYGRFDALEFLNENLLFQPYGKYPTLFEFLMIQNRVNDKMISHFIVHKEACKICRNYNKVYLLKHAKKGFLLYEYSDGFRVIDLLIKGNNADRDTFYQLGSFDKESIINSIVGSKAYRYLVFYPNVLFERAHKYPNKTYLDVLLENYNKSMDSYLADININDISLENRAKLYIKCSDYGLNAFLPILTSRILLQKSNGISFIEALLNEDRDKTLTRVLTPKLYRNSQIAAILEMYGVRVVDANVPTDKKDEAKETKEKLLRQKVSPEVERKLLELKKLFMNDGISDSSLVEVLIASYKSLASNNYKYLDRELDILLSYKRKYSNFAIVRSEAKPYFDATSRMINLNNSLVGVFNHEIGHTFHHICATNRAPKNIGTIIYEIRNNNETLKKVKSFTDEFTKLEDRVKEEASLIYKKRYANYFDKNRKAKIKALLNAESETLAKSFEEIGINPNRIKKAISELYNISEEEYIERFEKAKTQEIASNIMLERYDAFSAISDIMDAIFYGRLKDEMVSKDGKNYSVIYGHGINYYNKEDNIFSEILADYSEIIKNPKSKEALEYLRFLVGNEFVDLINEFYEQDVLGIKPLSLEEGVLHARR